MCTLETSRTSCDRLTMTVDTPAARKRLADLEATMRELDPCSDEYWALKPERNKLREAVDVFWCDEHGYGTRSGRWAPLPWPDKTLARWRVLREYVEEFRGVPVGDVVGPDYTSDQLNGLSEVHGALGPSVRQWVALLDVLEGDRWWAVFRDTLSLRKFNNRFVSMMEQGEGDYHWATLIAQLLDDDPPVHGFYLNGRGEFVHDGKPPEYGPYGSYPRLTDFVRAIFNAYQRPLGWPFPRLAAVTKESHGHAKAGSYEDMIRGVWAAPMTPRGAELLSADVRDQVLAVFAVEGYTPREGVADTESLMTMFGIDPERLCDCITEVCMDLDVDIEVEVPTDTLAQLCAAVQASLSHIE